MAQILNSASSRPTGGWPSAPGPGRAATRSPCHYGARRHCDNSHILSGIFLRGYHWRGWAASGQDHAHGSARHPHRQGPAPGTPQPRGSPRRSRHHRRRPAGRRRGRRAGAPAVVRPPGQAQLPGEPQERPLPGGLLVLFAAPRLEGGDPQVHLAEARAGRRGRRRRARGRREARLPGRQRPWPDGPRHRPGRGHHRRDQGRQRGRRGLRLPGPALRQPGGAAQGGRRRRVQPQPEHLRGHLRRHHHHPHVRRPGGHRQQGARRRPLRLLRPDRRHGRERRGPGRRGLRAARAGLGLGAGQLPDPVRGHPARQGVEPQPAALPAHPGDGAVRLPRRRGPDRRRP